MNLFFRTYKKLPAKFSNHVYDLLLGDLLKFIRYCFDFFWIKTKRNLRSFLPLFQNQSGIEIGGGTFLFSRDGWFPIYSLAQSVDGCNFSKETMWEGNIVSKSYIYNGIELGEQFIAEATNLDSVTNKQYDFIISSNCLEHCANPLKAIKSWLKVLKENGYILLILPNKQANFDHRREYTSFTHLLEDFNKDINEEDLTHFEEIMIFHDLTMDYGINSKEQFIERSKKNYENRCFHHHVFSKSSLVEIYQFFNLNILYCGKDINNIYIIGTKKLCN